MGFQECWDRVRQATGIKTQAELADAIGRNSANVSEAKKRDTFPLEWILRISDSYNVCFDYILYGEGPMHRDQKVAPLRNHQVSQPETPPDLPEAVDDELDVFDPTTLHPDEFWSYWHAWLDSHPSRPGWAQIELSHRLPEFTQWLEGEWRKKRRLDSHQDAPERSKVVGGD